MESFSPLSAVERALLTAKTGGLKPPIPNDKRIRKAVLAGEAELIDERRPRIELSEELAKGIDPRARRMLAPRVVTDSAKSYAGKGYRVPMAEPLRTTKAIRAKIIADTLEASDAFFKAAKEQLKKMFDVIQTTPKLKRRVSGESALKTAWSGYAARALLLHGGHVRYERKSNQKDFDYGAFFKELGYDRDNELEKQLVVALSGDLEVDLAVNFVARVVGKYSYKEFVSTMDKLYTRCFEAVSCNLTLALQGSEYIPFSSDDPAAIEAFFNDLTAIPGKGFNDYPEMDDARVSGIAGFKDFRSSWLSAYTLPAAYRLKDGVVRSTILPSVAHTTTFGDNWDTHGQSVDIGAVLGVQFLAPGRPDAIYSLNGRQIEAIQSALHDDVLFWGERRALAAAREELKEKKRKKTYITDIEAKLETANKTIERLQEQQRTVRALKSGEVAIDKSELAELRQRLKKAEARAQVFESENDRMSGLLSAAEDAIKNEAKARNELHSVKAQLDNLNQAVLAFSQLPDTEPEQTEELCAFEDTSVFDGLNIVVVGGWASFAAALQQIHPNVRCYGVRRPPDAVLRNASVVWMNVKYISHGDSGPMSDVCHRFHVPMRFFTSLSVPTCQKQLLEETKRMKDAGIL